MPFLQRDAYTSPTVNSASTRFCRNRDNVHVVFLQDFSKFRCVFRISVDDEVRVALEKAVVERGKVERYLFHEDSVRVWCGYRDMDPAGLQLNREQDVERNQTRGSPDFGGEAIGSGKGVLCQNSALLK